MLEDIRKDIGIFVARLLGQRRPLHQTHFGGIYSNARSALFIVPNDESHRSFVLEILRKAQLQFQRNALTIVTPEPSAALSGRLQQCNMIPVRDEHINFFFLAKKSLLRQIKENKYDVIVDLNLSITPLSASICAVIDAPLKAGFSSPHSDALYNFQLHTTTALKPKERYERLLHTLAMF